MRVLFYLCMVCALIIAIIIPVADFLMSQYEQYSHFHMGRWKDVPEWRNAVKRKCKKWAIHTPILYIKNDNRYVLVDRFFKNKSKRMVQSWQKAGCLLGIESTNDYKREIEKIRYQLLDNEGNWRTPVNKVDYAMMAYILLRTATNKQTVKPAMDSMILCIEDNLNADGMISYSAGKISRRRYVDTLGFVCPFLALYGKVYNKPEYITMAMQQISLFREKGMLRGLPVHCFSSEDDYPIGIYGWGRGTGWYALALIDTYMEVEDQYYKENLLEWIRELAEKLGQLALEDGGFSTILPAKNRYDSSATAILGYFLACYGVHHSDEKAIICARRCRTRLMQVTKKSGIIDQCQGDTLDIGIFSQRFSWMPFVQGIALRLDSELKKIE